MILFGHSTTWFHVFYAPCILIVNDKLSEWFGLTWRNSFPLPFHFHFPLTMLHMSTEYIYLFEVKRKNFSLSNNNNIHYYCSIVWRPFFLWQQSSANALNLMELMVFSNTAKCSPPDGALNEYKINKTNKMNRIKWRFVSIFNWKTMNFWRFYFTFWINGFLMHFLFNWLYFTFILPEQQHIRKSIRHSLWYSIIWPLLCSVVNSLIIMTYLGLAVFVLYSWIMNQHGAQRQGNQLFQWMSMRSHVLATDTHKHTEKRKISAHFMLNNIDHVTAVEFAF